MVYLAGGPGLRGAPPGAFFYPPIEEITLPLFPEAAAHAKHDLLLRRHQASKGTDLRGGAVAEASLLRRTSS